MYLRFYIKTAIQSWFLIPVEKFSKLNDMMANWHKNINYLSVQYLISDCDRMLIRLAFLSITGNDRTMFNWKTIFLEASINSDEWSIPAFSLLDTVIWVHAEDRYNSILPLPNSVTDICFHVIELSHNTFSKAINPSHTYLTHGQDCLEWDE